MSKDPTTTGQLRRVALAAAVLAVLPLSSSHAEGLIQSFFHSLGHVLQAPARLPERLPALVEPDRVERMIDPSQQRAEAGPAKAFCVRTCDGHYFPVQAHPGMSAAEACHSFCPASQTKLYSGGNIDYAVGRDGSRYADLPNAYAYRKQLVVGCTCNGRDQFGLARVDPASDPTLKPGDVVATADGMMAFTGRKNGAAEFTPAAGYSHFSKGFRDQLSDMRIAPERPTTPADAQASLAPPERDFTLRSAQR